MFKENFENKPLNSEEGKGNDHGKPIIDRKEEEKKPGIWDYFLGKPAGEQIQRLDKGLEEVRRICDLDKRGLLPKKKRPKVTK